MIAWHRRVRTDWKVGDQVEIRSFAEISATLDEDGALEGLPFMPEMARYCGGRFTIAKLAHKACDTIDSYQNRRMADAVHLDLRCGGEAHGGCQAGCLLYWKAAWLKPVDARLGETNARPPGPAHSAADLATLQRATQLPSREDGGPRYRCQATELRRATTPLSCWELGQYVEDLASGNVRWRDFIRAVAIEIYNKLQQRLKVGRPYPSVRGRALGKAPADQLKLRPGEVVEVRSKAEIMATLGADQKNRGLWFDAEMLRHCGRRFRVLRRVERLIDERTGKMIGLRNDCIILDGAACTGLTCRNRLFCPRGIHAFWREAWLRRV